MTSKGTDKSKAKNCPPQGTSTGNPTPMETNDPTTEKRAHPSDDAGSSK